MRTNFITLLTGIALSSTAVYAQDLPTQKIVGDGFTYTLNTPDGWLADAHAAKTQEMKAVFIPSTSTWDNAGSKIYTSVASLDLAKNESIYDVIDFDINMYKLSAPSIVITDGDPIVVDRGHGVAKVIKVAGGADGYQVIAYMDEAKGVPFVVMSSQTKADFDRDYATFVQVVGSYRFFENLPTANAR